MLYAVEDFAHLSKGQWVADDATNKMVNDLIHNYIKIERFTRCIT
jgi:DNA-directed RNA polymerase subunit beta